MLHAAYASLFMVLPVVVAALHCAEHLSALKYARSFFCATFLTLVVRPRPVHFLLSSGLAECDAVRQLMRH